VLLSLAAAAAAVAGVVAFGVDGEDVVGLLLPLLHARPACWCCMTCRICKERWWCVNGYSSNMADVVAGCMLMDAVPARPQTCQLQ
jgi:hypothetical protein